MYTLIQNPHTHLFQIIVSEYKIMKVNQYELLQCLFKSVVSQTTDEISKQNTSYINQTSQLDQMSQLISSVQN